MTLANQIDYVSTDDERQEIAWVRVRDREGRVTEYAEEGSVLTPDQIARAPKRRMDCVDCHNRPTHIYLSPDEAVNNSLAAGRLDASLPYLKRQAVEVLSKPYETNDEALDDGQAADLVPAHDLDGFESRRVGRDRHGVCLHDLADGHCAAPLVMAVAEQSQ